MLRIGSLFLWLSLACGNLSANTVIELDVVFSDSTVQCRYLYVLSPNMEGTNDTIAVFDTLSFSGQRRVSLFYLMSSAGKNMLLLVDSAGVHIAGKPFRISPRQTVFTVAVGQQQIRVTGKDFLYPLKNEDERSYYIFLLIFFAVKILVTATFIFASKLPKRNISIAAGAFILSAFADWLLPVNYLYRFLTAMLIEYLLIALIARKTISWRQAAWLILIVNLAGYGIIAFLYLFFVFI